MGLPPPLTRFSRQAFIAWENTRPDKHECVAGEGFAMIGARRTHVTVSGNCVVLLKNHLRGTPCRASMADITAEVAAADAVFEDL
jgi:hypothetical protein